MIAAPPGGEAHPAVGTLFRDQHAALLAISRLHLAGAPFECDPTYGHGGFYRRGVSAPPLKFDLAPRHADVVQADCRSLPLADASLQSLVFDPPFNHAPGYRSQAAHHALYQAALVEFARLLRPGGILVFKCQDTVESGRQVWNHVLIYQWALAAGFEGLDFLVLAKRSSVRGWNWARQQHAHRSHCYFWVFRRVR
jgi:SAM-dependent methyltransferase